MMLRPKTPVYKVVKGDSLWKIAKLQYGEPLVWPFISRVNHLPNADLILVGMTLKLPPAPEPRHRHHKQHKHSDATPHLQQTHAAPMAPVTVDGLGHGAGPSTTAPVQGPGFGAAGRDPGPTIGYIPPSREKQGAKGHIPAMPVTWPAVKYKLDDAIAPLVISTPEADISLRFIGEISLQHKGVMVEVEVSQRNMFSGKARATYDTSLANLAGSVKVGMNPATRELQLQCGFTVAAKLNGQVLSTSEYSFTPPNRFKYTYKPKPIQGESGEMVFSGVLGFEIELTLKKPDSPPMAEPVRVPQPSRVPVWAYAGAAVLVVGGVVIIGGDAIKDVFTGPPGWLETPLSWAAAMALFARAGAMVR